MNPLNYLLVQLDWSEVSVKNKLLSVFSFCFIIASITSIFINIYLQLPFQINIVVLFVLFIHSIAFYCAIRNKISNKGRFLYLTALVSLLPFAWVFNGGMLGSIPIYYFVYFTASILTLTRNYRNYFIAYIILITIIPLYIDTFHPDLIIPYTSEHAQFMDIKMSFIQVIFTTILLTTTYTSINDDIQLQLIKYQERLEDSYTKLAESKQYAEEAAIAKTNFITNISHEIRTPLTGIIGISDLLGVSTLNPEQKLLIRSLDYSSKILLGLVNDLLDLSKIEANKLHLNIEAFDIKESIKKIETIMALQIKEKNIDFKISISDDVPTYLQLDRNKYKQVLINLLSNAIKFTEHGSVSCQIIYNREKSRLITVVEDTGIGINKNDFDKLFTPFTQLNKHNHGNYNGVGMGLTISKKMVEIMKGQIYFDSTLAKGSCFSFTLPVPISEQTSLPEKKVSNVNSPSLHLLIAEDNKINQMVLTKMISKLNHTFDVAENGKDAINMCMENNYDAVLMDIQMPVVNGIEASKTILEYHDSANRKAPKIIICSANIQHLNNDPELKKSIAGFLSKPINLHQVDEILSKV